MNAPQHGGARDHLLLSARHFSKAFGDKFVLADVDLDIHRGEIHGLVGQNGSGKSTLIKILAGYHDPEPGAELIIDGAEISLPLAPDEPAKLGLHFVHQDLALVDSASILENLSVATYRTRFGKIRWQEQRRVVREALLRFDLDWAPDRLVSTLGPTERALLAIARAFDQMQAGERAVLIVDEPTAYLTRDGVDRLFTALRRVAESGSAVLFVGHDLSEILTVTDHVTVLRNGRRVETAPTPGLSERDLAELILGFPLGELYPDERDVTGAPLFEFQGATADGSFEAALTIREGEIVGVTGLLGSGFERLPYAAFGAEQGIQGHVTVGGETTPLASFRPPEAIRAGLALIPQDRVREGGVASATARENFTLTDLMRYRAKGRLDVGRERRRTHEIMSEFNAVPPEPGKPFGEFSGGNQQKLVLAKWFALDPRVVLLAEPTQGVDVGARREILGRIRDLADDGAAVLIASSEHADLAHLCNRVIVFRRGHVADELRGDDLTQERILERCLVPRTNGDRTS